MSDTEESVMNMDRIKAPPIPNILPPASLCMTGNVAENWRSWKQMWKHYSTVMCVDKYPVDFGVALLLHALGPEANKVYSVFEFAEDEVKDIKTIIAKMDAYTIGETNETYERYVFNNRVQQEVETFDVFLTEIRTLSKSCNFCDCMRDSLIRDRIVTGIKDGGTRKRLLQEGKLTLTKCIGICRSSEATTERLKTMSAVVEDVHYASRKSTHVGKKKSSYKEKSRWTTDDRREKKHCKFCGYEHILDRKKCPAWNKTCMKCKGDNHFASMCRHHGKNKVHGVYEDEDGYSDDNVSDEFIGSITLECNKVQTGSDQKSLLDLMLLANLLDFR